MLTINSKFHNSDNRHYFNRYYFVYSWIYWIKCRNRSNFSNFKGPGWNKTYHGKFLDKFFYFICG